MMSEIDMNERMPSRFIFGKTFLLVAAIVGAGSLGACADVEEAPAAAAATPAADMRDIGYSIGAEDALVTVYEFSDFGCPYCAVFALQTLPELSRDFIATGKVRWTYVPFAIPGRFPNGPEAALISECAGEQEKFWEMHDLLYERQAEWKGSDTPEQLGSVYAAELTLDTDRFASCYQERRGAERTLYNNQAAGMLGVRATPSFFINGRLIEGALPVEYFRQVLTLITGEP